jgi:hypothetical protein
MSSYQISSKPFREAHLDVFRVAESHKSECYNNAKVMDALGKVHQFGTHLLDGRILYISGYMYAAPGVVEVYSHPSIYTLDCPLVYVRHMKWWINHVARETNARRLQTWGDCSDANSRWLRCIGFKQEAVLDSYRLDGNSSIWGRVICRA